MTKQRAIGLDYLRIILALLIFFFHSRDYCFFKYGIVDGFFGNGATSMSAFFMLSGWALYITYRDKNFSDLRNLKVFFVKRLLSILPLYYLISLLFVVFVGKETVLQNIVLFPIEALGLQSLIAGTFPLTHNGGTWFISCILVCYLVFPFVKDCFRSLSERSIYWLMAVFYILLSILPIIQLYYRYDLESVYPNPFLRILEFSIGVFLAILWDKYQVGGGKNILISLLRNKWIFLLSLMVWFLSTSVPSWLNVPHVGYVAYNAIVIPCSMCIIMFLGTLQCRGNGNHTVLMYLSSISYGFYLSQLLAFPLTIYMLPESLLSGPCGILVSMVLCLVISIISYELVLKPIKKTFSPK